MLGGVNWRGISTRAASEPTDVSELLWEEQVVAVLNDWQASGSQNLILSPDVDGLTTACLLASKFPCRIAGIYTGQHLLLTGDGTLDEARDALGFGGRESRLSGGLGCVSERVGVHRHAIGK